MRTLLSEKNTKLDKLNGIDYLLKGLSLAPHVLSGFGNVCSSSTIGCRSTCVLWFTGRTVTQSVRAAMVERTRLLFADRQAFEVKLCSEIKRHRDKAFSKGLQPVLRLNVASDLDWSHIARQFPDVLFYDYTKVKSRLRQADWPSNYQLTYSVNERTDNRTIGYFLRSGINAAAVFSTRYLPQRGRIDPLPESYRFGGREWQVVDGDRRDLRLKELDGQGVIVGLRFKGSLRRRALAIRNGFCLDVTS